MMKKSLKMLLLSLSAVLVVLLAGCAGGGSSSDTASEGSDTSTEESSQEQTEESIETEESTEAEGEESEGDQAANSEREELVVAISAGYEPFMFEKDGELTGYDHDILEEYEERTGTKVVYENADFSGLLGLLESGRADTVAAQMSPTPEREEKFAFTEPITYYGSTIVVAEDNDEIQSVEDLAGKTVGVGSGNEMQQDIEAMYEDGEINWEVYTSATLENMLQDVVNGRLDAMVAQDVQAYVAINKTDAPAKVLPPFESSTGHFVVRKDDKALLDELNAFIEEIRADGTLTAISEKWIGTDISQPSN